MPLHPCSFVRGTKQQGTFSWSCFTSIMGWQGLCSKSPPRGTQAVGATLAAMVGVRGKCSLTHRGQEAGAPQCQCGHGPRCHKRSKKTVSFDFSSQLASGPQSALHVREGQCPAPHTPECLPVLTSQPRGPSTGSVPGPVAKAQVGLRGEAPEAPLPGGLAEG